MDIKILSSGCTNCTKLENNLVEALERLGVIATITKVEAAEEILKYGVSLAPALVIDGQIKAAGYVPNADEIIAMLR